jgi:hypothetical protein
LLVVRHLIEDIHIRLDGLRWLAPASIENGVAAPIRVAAGGWSLFITVFSVLMASAVSALAAASAS